MPAGDGLRAYDQEGSPPAGPEPAQENPEEPIDVSQFRPWVAGLQRKDLLAERDVLQDQTGPRAEDGQDGAEEELEVVEGAGYS